MTQQTDSRRAGQHAAHLALSDIKYPDKPAWVLAMVGGRHAVDEVLEGFKRVLGDIPVYGGSCVGAVTHDGLGYAGYEVAVAVFSDRYQPPVVLQARDIEGRENAAGRELGEQLRLCADADDSVLLFYDLVCQQRNGEVNVGSDLLDGLYEVIDARNGPRIFGAGLLGDFNLQGSCIFNGIESKKGWALAFVLPKQLQTELHVMHGCTPVGSYMTVTKVDGAKIFEIEGKPATQLICDLLQVDPKKEDVALAFSILLGRNTGDPFGPYREACYINRLIIDADFNEGWVKLFESDIKEGEKVQIMMRDNPFMMQSVSNGVSDMVEKAAAQRIALALYIDCAGRASAFTGSDEEEAAQVRKLLTNKIPLLGFYVGREIAPISGRSRPLDWTGVLVFIKEAQSR
ncbi:MAG: FIST C-terminal domain-containing protein [Gammaproteobacteria bacterium]|nr:FIST C-terminal domain-containing protein [Gammaproteobacteria bacterium]